MTSSAKASKIALYTCYFGAPEPLNTGVFGRALGQYPCFVFTDDPALVVPEGVTAIVQPETGIGANLASRRAKLMPDRYLSEFDWSIYTDNNSTLLCDPASLIAELQQNGSPAVSFTRHPYRDCIFVEGRLCMTRGRENIQRIADQLEYYRSEGFAEHAGMVHGGFIVRHHRAPQVAALGLSWYEHVLHFSRRDQISLPFVARQLEIELNILDPDGPNAPYFEWPVFTHADRRDMKGQGQNPEGRELGRAAMFGRRARTKLRIWYHTRAARQRYSKAG